MLKSRRAIWLCSDEAPDSSWILEYGKGGVWKGRPHGALVLGFVLCMRRLRVFSSPMYLLLNHGLLATDL